jgi:hypothetical protein
MSVSGGFSRTEVGVSALEAGVGATAERPSRPLTRPYALRVRIIAVGVEPVGVLAIGANATGIVAIGQLASGVVAVGQLARGVLAVGQLSVGIVAIGQLAVAVDKATAMIGVGTRSGGGAVWRVPRGVIVLLAAIWLALAGWWLWHDLSRPGGILRDPRPAACADDPFRAC